MITYAIVKKAIWFKYWKNNLDGPFYNLITNI